MKWTILAISILFSIPSSAKALTMEQCVEIARLAEVIMEARQTGVSPIDLMGAVKKAPTGEMMLKDAYDDPFYATEEYKQQAIRMFRDEWYIICLKAIDQEKGTK